MTEDLLRPLEHEADLTDAGRTVVVYKHSTRCWMSTKALRQIEAFAERHAEVPIFVVDVVAHAALAQALARRYRVRHESPQVLLLHEDEVVWHASHGGVTAEALERQLGAVTAVE